jgi:hypothetical protein
MGSKFQAADECRVYIQLTDYCSWLDYVSRLLGWAAVALADVSEAAG